MSFPDHCSFADQAPIIWLDLLPQELAEKIAHTVSGGNRTVDALQLAQTSTLQRRAVVSALFGSFTLRGYNSENESAWISCFIPEVRKVAVGRLYAGLETRLRTQVSVLSSGPCLTSAKIPDDPVLLHAVGRATCLRELTVLDTDTTWPGMSATRLLLQTLSGLSLRKLDLHCSMPWNSTCMFTRIAQNGDCLLANCCPNLTSFGSLCACSHDNHPFWTIWSSFPHIREISLERDPPDWLIPRLRTLKSARIRCTTDATAALRLAKRLGPSVTFVYVGSNWSVAQRDLEVISECKNLSGLRMVVDEGTECSVEKALPAVSGLNSLALSWKFAHRRPLKREVKYWPLSERGRKKRFSHDRLCDVTIGTMMSIVQRMPALASLDILRVRISVAEVGSILKHLGGQLRHFGVSFNDQHEPAVERFRIILETIVERNRDLRSVSAGKERMPDFLLIDKIEERFLTAEQTLQLRKAKNLLHFLTRRVRKCVPFFDMHSLRNWIDAVEWIGGKE